MDRTRVWGATACPALLSTEVTCKLSRALVATSSRWALGTAVAGFLPCVLQPSHPMGCAGQDYFPNYSPIRGNKGLGMLSVLHKVTGMSIYLRLLKVHASFFSKSPLTYPLRKCHSPCSSHSWARLMPNPAQGEECPLHTPPLQPHQEDHVTRPIGCLSRTFVIAEKEQICLYCWK